MIGRKSDAFTHTVAVKFGALTGYLDADGALVSTAVKLTKTTLGFQVPTGFYEQIPNHAAGTCTLTCTTYSGASAVGSAATTFRVTAAKSLCAPGVAIVVRDVNSKSVALTGDNTKLIRYVSTARCAVAATAKNSATVKTLKVDGVNVGENMVEFANVDRGSFTAVCTDSRGYSSSATAAATLVPYVKLTCNVAAKRLTPTGSTARLNIKGTCFSGSFGAASNTLTLAYKVGTASAVTVTPTISGNVFAATVNIADLDYTKSYSVIVTVKDAVSTVSKTVTIQSGVPVFDWGKSDFAFHVPVSIQGNTLSDFVVEQGSKDIWNYRKWASGCVECWGLVQTTVPEGLTQKGSIYWSAPVTVAYPFNIAQAYRYTTVANVGILSASITGSESTGISFGLQCSADNMAGSNAVVFVYVRGLWK